jgi:serine/threonine-protein kinase
MQVDRQGQSTLLVPEEAPWCEPRSSPDGHWLAMRRVGVPDCTLWLFDLRRKLLTRVSPEDEDLHRLDWSADSKSLLFEIDRKGFRRIGRIPIDGSGPIEVLTTGDYDFLSASALPDGSGLLCTTRKDAAGGDIVVWDFASKAEKPILVTPAKESEPRISPDGQWLAYESNVSGRTEVYLRSFTDSSSRVQVSTAGGGAPRWSRDGRELFYQLEDALLAVAVRNEPALDVSAPEVVFRGLNPRPGLNYDVAPDGQGFVVIEGEHREQAGSLHVIANWPRMLEAAAPR